MAPSLLNHTGVSGITGKLSFDPQEPLVLEPLAHVGTIESPRVCAVADSHLTNAARLRAELERLGHHWPDDSDSLLVAHAYAEWGPSCVMRLRGPFACAIWDDAARRLVLARDHVGIHPLYFALLPDHGVVFASEIGALLRDPRVGREWSAPAIDAYLALGYVPAPLTPYQRITKLEPGQMVIVEGRRLRSEQYWHFPATTEHTPLPDAESVDALEHVLRGAVRRTLTPGDATALLYSGGVASSALLTAWPRAARGPITVAIDQSATELTRSHAAAAHLGRVRELETVTIPIAAAAAELAAAFNEPIADPSALMQFATCRAVRRYTDTAVAGHGAAAFWLDAAHERQAVWDGFRRREIYTRGFAWQVRDADPPSANAHTFLADSTLAAVHHAAAAAGVRLHFPFLEQDLVQLAFASATAPRSWGLVRRSLGEGGHHRASVLQQLLQRRLPRPLLPSLKPATRQAWLDAALVAMVPSVLLTPRFDGRGIVSRPAVAHLWHEHRAGRRDHARRLWALVMLECWFRECIDGDAAGEPLEYATLVKVA